MAGRTLLLPAMLLLPKPAKRKAKLTTPQQAALYHARKRRRAKRKD
jgi:hypothetical protein